jgi:Flp pilus assembly protein TadG
MTRHRRKGVALTLEMVMILPILLLVLMGGVEFTLLLSAGQAVSTAAEAGAREAALPSSTKASIQAAVARALEGYVWRTKQETLVFVNQVKDTTGTLVTAAHTGDIVQVTVNVAARHTAPDVLSIVKISLNTNDVTSSFVVQRPS